MSTNAVRAVALAAQAAHSPAFRIRVVLPAQALARWRIHVDLLPLFSSSQAEKFGTAGTVERGMVALAARRTLRRAVGDIRNDVTTVLIQRQADILPAISIERHAAAGRRLVFDIDDAIWHDGVSSGGHRLGWLKGTRHKVQWLADRADVVVAGNELLAEFLSTRGRDVRVIPSLVDMARTDLRLHADSETVVVGWIGSATTAPFLANLRSVIQWMARTLAPRTVELLVVGGRIEPVPGVLTTVVPWSETAERAALQRMDIGLMPLPDNEFTRGKCAYKALQCMAAGIPVVADDVGVSARVIGDGDGGLIVRTDDGWREALVALAKDVGLRQTLGAEGRRRVARDFSYERWLPELARALGAS